MRGGVSWLRVGGRGGGALWGEGGLSSRGSHEVLMFSPQSRFEVWCWPGWLHPLGYWWTGSPRRSWSWHLSLQGVSGGFIVSGVLHMWGTFVYQWGKDTSQFLCQQVRWWFYGCHDRSEGDSLFAYLGQVIDLWWGWDWWVRYIRCLVVMLPFCSYSLRVVKILFSLLLVRYASPSCRHHHLRHILKQEEGSYWRRRVLETLHIHLQQQTLNLDCGLNINTAWLPLLNRPPWPLTRKPHPWWLLCTPFDFIFSFFFFFAIISIYSLTQL